MSKRKIITTPIGIWDIEALATASRETADEVRSQIQHRVDQMLEVWMHSYTLDWVPAYNRVIITHPPFPDPGSIQEAYVDAYREIADATAPGALDAGYRHLFDVAQSYGREDK